MARGIKKFLLILMTILLSITATEGVATTLPHAVALDYQGPTAPRKSANERDLSLVINILESRIGSYRIPTQAKEKLAAMDEKEFGLVEALCGRIAARSGDSPGSDLALLLAAALIVLS
jgi:hypothetical protein